MKIELLEHISKTIDELDRRLVLQLITITQIMATLDRTTQHLKGEHYVKNIKNILILD